MLGSGDTIGCEENCDEGIDGLENGLSQNETAFYLYDDKIIIFCYNMENSYKQRGANMLKVIALNGSPRKEGNTKQSLEIVANVLRNHDIEVEIVQLGGNLLHGCQACGGCDKNKNRKCVFGDDGLNDILQKVFEADGILIGSPTYYSNVTTEVKAFIDRCGFVARANGGLLKHKVGAPVVAVRRSGANFVYAAINFFFGISQMPIATSSYWNMTLSLMPGDVQKDEEGKATFENLGENMAWMLRKLNA